MAEKINSVGFYRDFFVFSGGAEIQFKRHRHWDLKQH
jgi:hypothetical protein